MNMTVLPLLAVGILMKFVAALFVLISLILILVVLMQKGRGGGLSGAFGGGMASGLLGSKTGDFLTWVTVVLVAVFLLLAVLMAKYYRPTSKYGRTATTTQQPVTGAQTAAPSQSGTAQPVTPAPGASGQPAPSGAAQPTAPAGQPSATPSTTGAGAQPAPGADAGSGK
jgi:preprotein translocase subunit SecG